jgi:hypothetical protein
MREGVGVSVASLALALAAGAATVAALEPVQPIDLTGSWTLQRDLSEPPRAPARRAGPPDGGPGGGGFGGGPPGGAPGGGPPGGGPPGGMGGGRGGPGGMSGPSRPPTAAEVARMRTAVLEAADPAPAIRIAQRGNEVMVGAADTQGYTFVTDGKKRKEPSAVGELEVKARWKGDRLVVETRLEGGIKTTRTLWLDASSGTPALVVLIKVEGGGLPNTVQARYVYRAAKT